MKQILYKPGVLAVLGLLALLVSACGTLELEREAAALERQEEIPTTGMAGPVQAEVAPAEVAAPADDTQLMAERAPEATAIVAGESAASITPNIENVVLPGCYDFDAGESLAPPDPTCDFTLLPGPDSGTIEIYPVALAQLAYGAVIPEVPEADQCAKNGAFSGKPEVVAPLAAMYVCFRTGEGRLGYLHFTAADLEQDYTVTFEWLTFAAEEDSVVPAAASDLVYQNEAFGYRLDFPESWRGFQATENGDDGVTSICFTFVGSTPVCVLQIDVYGKEAWNNLERIPDGYYLAENDEFVFAAGPYASECVQLDDFQCARHKEVPGILSGLVVE